MPENGQLKEFDNKILKSEIKAFKEDGSRDGLLSLLHCLKCSAVFVPGKVEPNTETENSGEKKLKFTPSVMREKNGAPFIPILTSRDEAPVIAGRKISGLALPFDSVCKMVADHAECDLLIINPFTDRLRVSKKMTETVMKMGTKVPTARLVKLEAGEKIAFISLTEEDAYLEEKARKYFETVPAVSKVYLTKMTSKDGTCYMFIIDMEEGEYDTLIPAFAKNLSEPRLKHGLSFASVKAFFPYLENENIKTIYEK